MPLTTTYITVPFIAGAGGALHPGIPRRSSARSEAILAADELAPFYAGVMVLRDRADAAAGIFLEPLLISATGRIPDDLVQQLAA